MQLDNIVFEHPDHGYCKADLSIENGIIKKINITDMSPLDFGNIEFYVTPGFVNSHLHPNQLLDRRLLDELNISELLHQMHGNYKKTDDDRYAQAVFVLMEAIKSGATSMYSVASHPFPVIKAYENLGVKGAVTCFYNDQWEGYGDPPALAYYESIEKQFLSAFEKQTPKVNIHIGSASVESASNQLLILLNDIAARLQTKVNIHVSEGKKSIESCMKSRGTTPVRLLSQLGILSEHWNLIHAVNIDEEEISLIGKTGASVIHCPVSNAKTGVGIAPIQALLKAGALVGLGSDACSNNNTNNILNEAYFCSLLHSAFYQNPQIVTQRILQEWLTTNGYQILGMKQTGTIEVGQPADLLLWSLHSDSFVPLPFGNFFSALIYNAPDIKPHTVLIDGKVIIEEYRFKIIPEEEIREAANACSFKMMSVENKR
jgi:5-methylthioadenosine/S-adenosylhomocysteine deaminase